MTLGFFVGRVSGPENHKLPSFIECAVIPLPLGMGGNVNKPNFRKTHQGFQRIPGATTLALRKTRMAVPVWHSSLYRPLWTSVNRQAGGVGESLGGFDC